MKHRSALIAGIVGVVVLALVILFAASGPDTGESGTNPLIGRPAPSIAAVDTKDRPFRIEDYRGRWLLVNFFATWCGPCKQEHPELVAFSQEHQRSADASIVSVAYDEKPQAIQEFFDANGGDWAVLAKGADDYSLQYGVVQIPESFLVDPDGTVVHKFIGGITAADVDRQIAEQAAKRKNGSQ